MMHAMKIDHVLLSSLRTLTAECIRMWWNNHGSWIDVYPRLPGKLRFGAHPVLIAGCAGLLTCSQERARV